MADNLTHRIIRDHLIEGDLTPGEEIALRIDQTLTQDATGTLVMLALEAMDIQRVKTERSAQYVDHNLLQEDHRNPDDHLFLQSACRRFGVWFSRPGNGVSHPLHQQHFGIPGKTLLGSDSHTPAAGAIGMLAVGAGGMDVALAMAGQPYRMTMPEVWGIRLTGELPPWVSAKDVILELLRRHDVDGGLGRILEYHGPGLRCLSAMDRHVIANMGTELGATTSIFPSDDEVKRFMTSVGREDEWCEFTADANASYDITEEIDLSRLEPLIAMPSSPGNVKRVRDVAGERIYQAYVGSSANPGLRDFAIAAEMVRGKRIPARVSFDVNPTSRRLLLDLMRGGHLTALIESGARIHQAGCNGCIGMGQAPATDRLSLRTVPRNFPGRSGTREDKVALVSPETATASALQGCITDPRDLDTPYPSIEQYESPIVLDDLEAPLPPEEARAITIVKGPNIEPIPDFDSLPETLALTVLLKLGDDISTDEIMPAGSRVLPFRSNIPGISRFVFEAVDETYVDRAGKVKGDGHLIVAGDNYGQGSSREHAALAPRYLGLRAVLATSFARIHARNLINFGVLPLTFENRADLDSLHPDEVLESKNIMESLQSDGTVAWRRTSDDWRITTRATLSPHQLELIRVGGLFNWARQNLNQ